MIKTKTRSLIFVLFVSSVAGGAEIPEEISSLFKPPPEFAADFGEYKSPLLFNDRTAVTTAAAASEATKSGMGEERIRSFVLRVPRVGVGRCEGAREGARGVGVRGRAGSVDAHAAQNTPLPARTAAPLPMSDGGTSLAHRSQYRIASAMPHSVSRR